MRIELPEWRPDLADLTTPFLTIANGVIGAPKGYGSIEGAGNTVRMSALTARCQGAAAFVSPIDQQVYIVAGDATKLYQNRAATATDVSKSGGYTCPGDDYWEFVALAGYVIATQIGDAIQGVLMNGLITFADLADSTLKPQARHIGVIGSQAMIGNTRESSVDYPNRVRWCAVDSNGLADPTDWDESQTTLADHQDMEDELGGVMGIAGGERYGLILCDNGLSRADFTGTPSIYSFNKLADAVGCLASGSIARLGGITYYLSQHGFVACNGQATVGIGDDKIDQWFFDNVYGTSLYHRISACVDPKRHLYIVAFPNTLSTGNANVFLYYHIPTGKWSYLDREVACEFLMLSKSEGVTLESIDTHIFGGAIDDMTLSLDSKIFAGGDPTLAFFNSAHQMRFFDSGSNHQVTVETSVLEPVEGHRCMIDHIRPLADGGTLSAFLAMRERLNDSETFGSAVSQNADGICPFETGNVGRFAKVRGRIAEGGTWTYIEALDLKATDMGMF